MASLCDILFALIICFPVQVSIIAQNPVPVISAYGTGTLEADRFSLNHSIHHLNPALLPFDSYTKLSAHAENSFSGFDISRISFQINHSFDRGFGGGLSFYHFGIPEYHLSGIQVSAGKRLSKTISIGINQKLSRVKADKEGRPWNGQTALAAMWMTEKNGWMFLIDGLMPFGNRDPSADLHSDLRLEVAGFHSLHPKTTLFLMMKYEMDQFFPRVAISQALIGPVGIYASLQIYPSRYGTGITFPISPSILCMISTQFHPVLGWSPAIGLQKSLHTGQKNSKPQPSELSLFLVTNAE